MQAKDCAAKASLSSKISISLRVNPAFFSAISVAGTGPYPMIAGSQPVTAIERIIARGFK